MNELKQTWKTMLSEFQDQAELKQDRSSSFLDAARAKWPAAGSAHRAV